MLFNSVQFVFFFPVVTVLYFLLPHKFRAVFLLAASCIFYMAFIPAYILILLLVIVIDYIAGICIERSQGGRRTLFLLMSIAANVGLLAIFKYYNFITENLVRIAHVLDLRYPLPLLQVILPIGLSFHTFQAMSYTIEVYRGKHKAERNPVIYALYVMFYPQLVAGPIERPQHLIPQFRAKHQFDSRRVPDGLKLMAWGLFKKVVIADRLAVLVNRVYGAPAEHAGLPLIVATVFFAFQIYCDFSGYSDIAIGAAQVMGFNLMKNFNRPYLATSIREFWQRWHISLSTWFRDYLYIPLGGNRVARWRWQANLLITFLISGLWHGANWTYVVWGALHGAYLLFAYQTAALRARMVEWSGLHRLPRVHQGLRMLVTFSLVCFAWIFFRARNLPEALYIATHLTTGLERLTSPRAIYASLSGLGLSPREFVLAVALVVFLGVVHAVQQQGSIRQMLSEQPAWRRWIVYYGVVLGILIGGRFNEQFVYFQF